MTFYIGLDAHSKTSTFVVVNGHGKPVMTQQIITCERELLGLIRGLHGTKKLIFEESHLSQWLYALLLKEVDELVVCHPGFLGKKPGAKTDLRDATHLAQELRCGHVVPVFHDPGRMMELRSLVSGYQDLVQEIVRTKNRYKALFRSQAIRTPGVGVFRSSDRIVELSRQVDRFVATSLFEQIIFLEERKKLFLEQCKSNMGKHPDLKRLDEIPGIDAVRAHVIAAIICSAQSRFQDRVFRFCGFTQAWTVTSWSPTAPGGSAPRPLDTCPLEGIQTSPALSRSAQPKLIHKSLSLWHVSGLWSDDSR